MSQKRFERVFSFDCLVKGWSDVSAAWRLSWFFCLLGICCSLVEDFFVLWLAECVEALHGTGEQLLVLILFDISQNFLNRLLLRMLRLLLAHFVRLECLYLLRFFEGFAARSFASLRMPDTTFRTNRWLAFAKEWSSCVSGSGCGFEKSIKQRHGCTLSLFYLLPFNCHYLPHADSWQKLLPIRYANFDADVIYLLLIFL